MIIYPDQCISAIAAMYQCITDINISKCVFSVNGMSI